MLVVATVGAAAATGLLQEMKNHVITPALTVIKVTFLTLITFFYVTDRRPRTTRRYMYQRPTYSMQALCNVMQRYAA